MERDGAAAETVNSDHQVCVQADDHPWTATRAKVGRAGGAASMTFATLSG